MTNNIFNTKKKLLEFIRGNVLPFGISLLPIPQGDFSLDLKIQLMQNDSLNTK